MIYRWKYQLFVALDSPNNIEKDLVFFFLLWSFNEKQSDCRNSLQIQYPFCWEPWNFKFQVVSLKLFHSCKIWCRLEEKIREIYFQLRLKNCFHTIANVPPRRHVNCFNFSLYFWDTSNEIEREESSVFGEWEHIAQTEKRCRLSDF